MGENEPRKERRRWDTEDWVLGVLAALCLLAFLALCAAALRYPHQEAATAELAANAALLAAALLALFAGGVGFFIFSLRREIRDEYHEVCNIRDRARELLECIEDASAEAKKTLEELGKGEKEAREAQKTRLEVADAFSKGLQALEGGYFDAAVRSFDRVIELDPENAGARNNRGLARHMKGDFDGAIADCTEAIKLDSTHVNAYNNRGNARTKTGDFGGANADYTRVIDLVPNEPAGYEPLAWLLATCPDDKCRNGTRAVELAEKAVALTGRKQHACLDILAAAYAEAKRFEEAVRTETEAIALLRPEEEEEEEEEKEEHFRSYSRSRSEEKIRHEYEAHLELYKAGRPFREERHK